MSGTGRWVAAWAILVFASALASAEAGARIVLPDSARAEGAADEAEPRVLARLLVHPDRAPGRLEVGVLFDLDPGWHIYWRNPGDTGLATEVRFAAPGARVSPLRWPAPRAFREGGLFTTYGYEGRVLLAADLRWDPTAPEPETLRADVDVLACKDECIPASFELSRSLAADAVDPAPEVRALFARARRELPLAAAALGLEVDATPGDGATLLRVRCDPGASDCALARGGARDFDFIPDSSTVGGVAQETWKGASPGFALRIPAAEGNGEGERVAGVLSFARANGTRAALAVDLELAAAGPAETAPAADGAAPGLLRALLLAFVGGLILNLMPCVLPVLAIKVVAVTELAQRHRREVLAHGAAYTGGILLTMGALAAAVVAMRAAGKSVGWGFQFQEPVFVAAISAVLVVFAMNLFGTFEISFHGGRLANLGHEAAGARRSFFEGLLAVVLATPCSAPFLGTAVGFAFAGSAALIFTVFLAIGAGLAAPFVLVTLVPAWARFMPRAGGWMLRLRAGLGFALLATVIWLFWILGRSAGIDTLATLMAFLLGVAFVAWLSGAAQEAGRSRLGLALGAAGLVLAGVGINTVGFAPRAASHAEAADDAVWQTFSPDAVATALAAGQPAFVYFTADWCITCAMNESLVLADERVESALDELGFARFKADWTRRDEGIRQELARHGKAGVPAYLVYASDAPDSPAVLPEVLTVDKLLEALREAAAP